MQVRSQNYDPLFDLIDDAVRIFGAPVRGQTQKEQARDEGRKNGKLEGICDGIAAFVTRRRLDRFPLTPSVPALDEWTVRKSVTQGFIHEVKEKYDASLATINGAPEITPAQKSEQRELARKHYWEGIADEVEEWVGIDLNFRAEYEALRRRKVLAGEVDPEVTDENWIAEEIENAQNAAAELEGILSKAQAKG